ncbi:MAG TPA: EF-hand domain-containing protein [Rhodanobacter sp.]
MSTLRFMLAAAALLGLTVTGTVHAQEGTPQPQARQQAPSQSMPAEDSQSGLPSFGDLDKAHRGYLTRGDIPKDVEGLKPLRAHFQEADSNGNGRLDANEYAAYAATQAPASKKTPGSPP